MTTEIILLTIFIGSNLGTAFFVSRYINRKWRLQAKEHALKIVKRARQIEKDYNNIDDDKLWDELSNFMR